MHLQPQSPQSVVDQCLYNPRWRVELIDDGQLVGTSRRTLILVADLLLFLPIEELVDPSEEVLRAIGVLWQVAVDHPDHLNQTTVCGPQARILVIGIEKNSNLRRDEPVRGGKPIPEECLLCAVIVFILAAARGAEIPQEKG